MRKYPVILAVIIFLGCATFAEGFSAVDVYKKTSKSVVLIIAQKNRKSSMIGSGSIITDSGLIVTNAHVVIDKSTSRPFSTIRVFLKPDKVTGNFSRDLVDRYTAEVVSYDSDLDLAILKAEGLSSTAGTIELADPKEINIGEEVVAIGHPEQGGLWSLTYGRISGEIADQSDVKGKDVYQTDTSVNRGNSGGPLLDGRGYMVGVNTNIARLGAGNLPITGVNFALKSSVVRNWLKKQGLTLAYGKAYLYEEKQVSEKKPVEEIKPEAEELKPKVEEKAKEVEEVKPKEEYKKPVEKESTKKIDDKKIAEVEKPKKIESDTILTPKRPYNIDDLYKEVERELEDMMEEMKMKIRRR